MFKFKLETLFKVRKRNKDKVMKQWTQELGQLQILNDERTSLSEEHKLYKKKYMQSLNSDDMQKILILKAHIDNFKLRYAHVDKKIEKQKQSIESIRGDLKLLSREFEIVKKLKEQKLKEYNDKLKKKEEKINDEINILKGKRGKKFGSI